jgi:uncharacterized protein YecT (DUF1311 family)
MSNNVFLYLVNKWQNLDLINRWKSLTLVKKILCIAAIVSAFAIGLFNLLVLLMILLTVLWFIALFKPNIVRANTRMQATKQFAFSFILVVVGASILAPAKNGSSVAASSSISTSTQQFFSQAVESVTAQAPSKNPRYTPIRASNGLYGYINTEGKAVIAPQFQEAIAFSDNGLAKISVDNKYGYINTEGKIVIQPQFKYAEDFTIDGLAKVVRSGDDKRGFVDEKGNFVDLTAVLNYYYGNFSNGLAWVESKLGGYGYINTEGKMVIEPYKFKKVGDFSKNGLARVSLENNKSGYINKKGDLVINGSGGDFSDNGLARTYGSGGISPFAQEYVRVTTGINLERSHNGGFFNEKGEMVINEENYVIEGDFSKNGLAKISVDKKYGFINSEGDIVIEPKFEEAKDFSENGLALVKVVEQDKYGGRVEKYGYINSQGEMVIQPQQFERTGSFTKSGLAEVWIRDGVTGESKKGYINEKGVFFSNEELEKSLMTLAVPVPVAVPEKAPLPTQAAVPADAAAPAPQEPSTPPENADMPAPAADAAAPAADAAIPAPVAEAAAPAPTTATTEQLELARYKAKDALDEANKQINGTWNAASKEMRKIVLPEQREWLKKRENDCDAKAKSDEPNNTVIQETIKFDCMTKMTYQRDGELGDQFEVLVGD